MSGRHDYAVLVELLSPPQGWRMLWGRRSSLMRRGMQLAKSERLQAMQACADIWTRLYAIQMTDDMDRGAAPVVESNRVSRYLGDSAGHADFS